MKRLAYVLLKNAVKGALKIRWGYFHINPRYAKFYMDKEPHFQNLKTGEVVSDYKIND
jgi:hypothetical protein